MSYKTGNRDFVSQPLPEFVEASENSPGHSASPSTWTPGRGQHRTPLRLIQHTGCLRSTVNIQTPESVNSPQCYEIAASCSAWNDSARPQHAQQAQDAQQASNQLGRTTNSTTPIGPK